MANAELMVNTSQAQGLALNNIKLYSAVDSNVGVAPMNVKNIKTKVKSGAILLNWTDPEDTYDGDNTLLARWAGTRIVYKENNYPTSPTDGTIINSTRRNAYETNELEISGLTNNTTYYICLFPYSDTGVFNKNTVNRTSDTPLAIPAKVSFASATDEEIEMILDAYYQGIININDYWKVGDTKKIRLSAMSSGTGASETHAAQDMTVVIIGLEADDLKTAISGKKKAAVTLQCREILGNNGTAEHGYIWGTNATTEISSNYSSNPRRTWLNGTFVNALPSGIRSLVKTVVKKNLASHSNEATAGTSTSDKAFLTSYPEMFGSTSYSYYKGSTTLEGAQYSYYNSSTNRTKYVNNNGTQGSSADFYWLRSPSTSGGNYWICVSKTGTASSATNSSIGYGIAPAFCL